MPRRSTAHHVLAITVATVTLWALLPASAAAGDCWYGFGVGLVMRGGNGSGAAWPAPVGQSGYDPFVLDHRTGKFRYVPIPYDPEPAGSGYNPYRLNWHSGRWDYVPYPVEQDYRLWDAAAAESAKRRDGLRGRGDGVSSTDVVGALDGAQSGAGSPIVAMDLSPSRAVQQTAVSRAIPPAPPPTPPRTMPAGPRATTRPTLARNPAPARTAPVPPSPAQPARGAAIPDRGDGGWTQLRGVTGRWDYDYQHARWIFVLPAD